MKTLLISLICSIALHAVYTANPDENTLWLENCQSFEINDDRFNGWGNFDPDQVTVEEVKNGVRLRKAAGVTYGKLQRYVPFDITDNSYFLKISISAVENIEKPSLDVAMLAGTGYICGRPGIPGIYSLPLSALSQIASAKTGRVALSLSLLGNAAPVPGLYTEVSQMAVVKDPADCLTMELLENAPADNIAQVGEKILLRFFNDGAQKPGQVSAAFVVCNGNLPLRFNKDENIILKDDGKNGDDEAGDQVYSAFVVIDQSSDRLVKQCQGGLIAAHALVGKRDRFAWSSFSFNIDTPNRTLEILKADTPQARAARREWLNLTYGRSNVALGKPCRFSANPNYRLTKDTHDELDLTDGAFTRMNDDRIWFSSNAVGFTRSTVGVNILIDLGTVQPIERVVVRALGGGEQGGSLTFPRELRLLVSDDGVTYYEAGQLTKLVLADRDSGGRSDVFRYPEDGICYTAPLAFTNLRTRGRFIGLRIFGDKDYLFLDEIVACRGNFNPAEISFAAKDKRPFYINGLIFTTIKGMLTVPLNYTAPTFFSLEDCRKMNDQTNAITYILELPRAVALAASTGSGNLEKSDITVQGKQYCRWETGNPKMAYRVHIGPFYFTAAAGSSVSSNLPAYVYAECAGYTPNRIELPILPITFPVVPTITNFHVSLSWMTEPDMLTWPDFFDNYRKLGFNGYPIFPRNWSDTDRVTYLARVEEARQLGFSIVYNESPFHVMVKNHKSDPELYSQLDKPSQNACPSYRGQWYKEEIKRVGDNAALVRPDYVLHDNELWYNGSRDAPRCKRCQAYKAELKAGDEFLTRLGTEMISDLANEVKKRLGTAPLTGLYDTYPSRPVYEFVFDFRNLYPSLTTLAQPAIYRKADGQFIRSIIRTNFELMKKKAIIPYLTAGCYGEFEPFKMELQIYETMLNGAGGFTYYIFHNFDTPLDYYYHARALANLAPHQKLVAAGRPLDVGCANANISVTAMKNGGELLLLAVNYATKTKEPAEIRLPFAKVTKLRNLSAGKDLPPAGSVSATLDNYEFTLWYVAGE